MRGLLKHRDARIYIVGQLFSLFGDSCLWLAMGIWVKTLTGSNAAAGLTFFFFTAPSLLAPASGLLSDRLRRRPLLVATNSLTGGAVLLLLLVHGAGEVWIVYLVMALYGLSYSVLGPAQSALLTVMVPTDLLPDANGALRTAQESLRLVGPLTGAALFVAVGAHTIAIIDAATFAVPVVSLLTLRIVELAPQPRAQRWRTELFAGLHHVYQTPQLRHVVIAGAISTTVFGFAETITFAIAANGLHERPAFVGVLVAVQGVGAVIGGLSAAALVRRIGESRLIGVALCTAAAGALFEVPPTFATVFAGFVLFGGAIPWLVVALISLVQRLTPSELQGRAYSAVDMLITVPQTISIALGAGLIAVTGYRPLLVAMAVVMSVAAAYLLTRPKLHRPQSVLEPSETELK
ncbi:MAG: MFS transporter [Acidobacteria bacterium]|nr:MFS transporter [Acidobacteriota bacterium]